jgi:hypothetical protein
MTSVLGSVGNLRTHCPYVGGYPPGEDLSLTAKSGLLERIASTRINAWLY